MTRDFFGAACPDEERLAAFVERTLPAGTSEAVEAHVAGCAACLDVVAAMLPAAQSSARIMHAVAGGPVAVAAPAPSRRARLGRWAIAASLVFATGAVLAAAFRQPLIDRATPALAGIASRLLGVPVHAGRLAVARGGDASTFVVTLGDVAVGKSDGRRVRVEELGVTVRLAAPVWGEPVVSRVRAVRPDVTLVHGVSGRELSWHDGSRVLGFLDRVGQVELVDARVVVPVRDGALEVTAINGGAVDADGERRLVLTGRAGNGDLHLAGTMTLDGRQVRLTLGGSDLDAGTLPVLAGRVTGRADMRLDIEGHPEAPRVDGRVALRGGRVLGIRPLWTMPLDAASRDVLAAARPSFAGTDLPFDDLRASFGWRDGVWRLPRLYLDADGVVAGGGARLRGDGALSGRGRVRLPKDVVAALEPHEAAVARARDHLGTATLPFTLSGRASAPRVGLAPEGP